MKFSVLRSNKNKELKHSKKLLKRMAYLNPTGHFWLEENNASHICSDLLAKDLSSLVLPFGASFTENPYSTALEYGCLFLTHKDKEYVVYCKGFEGSVLFV